MKNIYIMQNPIQHYSWGSRTEIARIMGKDIPSKKPEAELWMGDHPQAPSDIFYQEKWCSLREIIDVHPEAILGTRVQKYSKCLPFLFKILAAESPLSIQVHPSQSQAASGYARENKAGIPLDAPHRNYKDAHHKPEILCALTPFWALSGFRPIAEILHLLEQISSQYLAPLQAYLTNYSEKEGLQKSLMFLMQLGKHQRQGAIEDVLFFCKNKEQDMCRWLVTLHALYPGDVGILCALLLNLIHLEPGEALFAPARRIHAYLQGTGVELMANSNNVLRGGLTKKHIDVKELFDITDFSVADKQKIHPVSVSAEEKFYPTSAKEFSLAKIMVSGTYHIDRNKHVSILLCTEGTATLSQKKGGYSIQIHQGMSALISAGVKEYSIHGQAVLFKATIPEQ